MGSILLTKLSSILRVRGGSSQHPKRQPYGAVYSPRARR